MFARNPDDKPVLLLPGFIDAMRCAVVSLILAKWLYQRRIQGLRAPYNPQDYANAFQDYHRALRYDRDTPIKAHTGKLPAIFAHATKCLFGKETWESGS